MPVYDYLCSACGMLTEVIHGIDAPPPRYCPNCGREGTLRKSFAPPAVVFKGSGWAKKDRSSAHRAAKGKEGAASKDSTDAAGASKGPDDSPSSSTSASSSESRSSSGSGSGAPGPTSEGR